ncbi:hypothetical protein Q5752_001409 [Cryptotrichosporon argae]
MPRPAALIHLGAIFRPSKLRPDLRVASINSLDYAGLRRAGFNAVVIDKDNCVTHPKSDAVWPAFAPGWARLQRAFEPGRVLIVSNSSGTRKDPGGIGAEVLSRSLRAPVLIHASPKPACASLVVSYFRARLPAPRTLPAPPPELGRAVSDEADDEAALVARWRADIDGPLCGPRVGRGWNQYRPQHGGQTDGRDVEEKMVDAENAAAARAKEARERKRDDDSEPERAPADDEAGADPLRIVVIGDRLFTDTLLAQQLRRLVDSPGPARPAVLAVHTTELPVRDVGVLRWLETTLSRGRLARANGVDWAAFDLDRRAAQAKRAEADAGAIAGARRAGQWGPAAWVARARARARRLDPRTWEAPHADLRRPGTWPYPLAYYGTLHAARALGWAGRRGAAGARWAWRRAERAGRAWAARGRMGAGVGADGVKERIGNAEAVVTQK